MSREFESYSVGRNLYLSKFCLECGLESSLETIFQDISRSLEQLGIHIESADIADADNIDEFLFDKLNEKELALLTLGVAVGMVRSVTLTLNAEESIPPSTQGKLVATVDMALQRIHMVLKELDALEIAGELFERVPPLLCDFNMLKGSNELLQSELQAFEERIRKRFD